MDVLHLRPPSSGAFSAAYFHRPKPDEAPLAPGPATRNSPHGRTYACRELEKTALYLVFQRHLPGFERIWADADSDTCLPRFVSQEL